jgi:hypothetical protein
MPCCSAWKPLPAISKASFRPKAMPSEMALVIFCSIIAPCTNGACLRTISRASSRSVFIIGGPAAGHDTAITERISPSLMLSHSTNSGIASPTTLSSESPKFRRLRRAAMAANWSDIATRKYSLIGEPPSPCFVEIIFQTLGTLPVWLESPEIASPGQGLPYSN